MTKPGHVPFERSRHFTREVWKMRLVALLSVWTGADMTTVSCYNFYDITGGTYVLLGGSKSSCVEITSLDVVIFWHGSPSATGARDAPRRASLGIGIEEVNRWNPAVRDHWGRRSYGRTLNWGINFLNNPQLSVDDWKRWSCFYCGTNFWLRHWKSKIDREIGIQGKRNGHWLRLSHGDVSGPWRNGLCCSSFGRDRVPSSLLGLWQTLARVVH